MNAPRFKLNTDAFLRTPEANKHNPKRVFFIAAEGEKTEPNYFGNLNLTLDAAIVRIEILQHAKSKGYNAPHHLTELLDECLELREGDVIPAEGFSDTFVEKYPPNRLKELVNNSNHPDYIEFMIDLDNEGIDCIYRKYLKNFNPEYDCFAIILDRDKRSHTYSMLLKCLEHCEAKKYFFCISNPCFEFWLLLHNLDVKNECNKEELDKFLENSRVNPKHTYISKKLSDVAGHAKRISRNKFNEKYYPNIRCATERAKLFAIDPREIITQLGTNVYLLIEEILSTSNN